ncbi:hypothetical protein Psta_3479 [Pirellula staleyi DSM 6068]|uniref:Uncharacterized protein n=1 Tax=Pirellula staleyi (strain ATCC 27377 / DSM 6068 / ICPB 4128) TaxID=530564 RepID=D2QYI2_PIRSD|nr:ATP-grasp fold amidoligase family protein [Pirellula staleyi]ADB18141.1 hypothetical protein Psta_3479 [Pirellula staleyi DSM 6068]
MQSMLHTFPKQQLSSLQILMRRWHIQQRYFRKFFELVNFEDPQSFREKTNYRKLYGNQPLYAQLADKYRVRQFVEQRIGAEHLVPLLGVYDRLTPEIFDTLPHQFIIKANHGCKWNKIVWDKSQLDIPATVKHFNQLLRRKYGLTSGEFHYALIEPKIVVEQLLVADGKEPVDYSVFCFHNSRGFEFGFNVEIQDTKRHIHFDQDWNVLEAHCSPEEVERYRRPKNHEQMVGLAERISRGFDFVRVDLYNLEGQIYFGEMTFTASAGLHKHGTPKRAALRNSQWELDRNNPLLYLQPHTIKQPGRFALATRGA